MYKIVSDYIFDIKEPMTDKLTIKTTHQVNKILQKIAIDNELSMSLLINNAILHYLVNDIEKEL